MPDGRVRVERALVSVADREGLGAFARGLASLGVELVSTGGTARAMRESGVEVREVAALTGMDEMLDGRVKTLHPAIHGGLLADLGNPDHAAALEARGIPRIDLVAVNFYPFRKMRDQGRDEAACIEAIDIGGPAMLRAAAKNSLRVLPVPDPSDYPEVIGHLSQYGGESSLEMRRRMAAKAFAATAAYDAAVAAWALRWRPETDIGHPLLAGGGAVELPQGENPHQRGWLHRLGGGVAGAERLSGPGMSYNNYLDADCAWRTAGEFAGEEGVSCTIVKHGTPCGAAVAGSAAEAFHLAQTADAESAFGGIVGFGGTVDRAAAEALAQKFLTVVIAPDYSDEAVSLLAERDSLRALKAQWEEESTTLLRSVAGGVLEQTPDSLADSTAMETVTGRAPSDAERTSLEFAWRLARCARSNAIVLARGTASAGIGSGQTSRVEALRGALARALASGVGGEGLCMASDGFLPFADSVHLAAEAGVRAVIQPGGSKRDEEVIEAADAAGMAMVFTGRRHFRH